VQGVTSVVARQNIALVESAERLWYDVAGEAVDAWTQKLDTLDNILSRAVGRLSEGSLSVIDYRSGKHYPIDAAVRRHCVSQIGQAGGRLTESILDEYDHELVFTSAHFGSRPEHEVWQGKAYCRSGRKTIDGVTYPDFYQATGYGDVAGLLGVNCRHSFGPYYPGITELPTVEQERGGMTSEQYYQATQKQRAYENRIRKTKREIALGEKAGLPMTQKRLELGHQQRLLKGHVEKNGLVRQYQREKAYGIGAQPRGLKRPTPAPSKKLPAGLTASQHTIDRSIERGVSLSHIEDAIKKPLHTLPIKIKNGKPSYQMIGEYATIAINPDTGVITTTWLTGKRTRKKYLSGSP
jgi:hypothetical protein